MRPEKRTSELANAMVSPFALTPFTAVMLSMMFALSHDQLALVMTAAGSLPVGKRGVFLERVAVRPQLRGPHFTDADLGERTCVPTEKTALCDGLFKREV